MQRQNLQNLCVQISFIFPGNSLNCAVILTYFVLKRIFKTAVFLPNWLKIIAKCWHSCLDGEWRHSSSVYLLWPPKSCKTALKRRGHNQDSGAAEPSGWEDRLPGGRMSGSESGSEDIPLGAQVHLRTRKSLCPVAYPYVFLKHKYSRATSWLNPSVLRWCHATILKNSDVFGHLFERFLKHKF